MTEHNRELVAAAAEALRAGFRPGHYHVAAAVRTENEQIVTGLHVETSVGRVALCAEAVAVGAALTQRLLPITAIAAVNYPGRVRGLGSARHQPVRHVPGADC
jgi:cytidine deaminase